MVLGCPTEHYLNSKDICARYQKIRSEAQSRVFYQLCLRRLPQVIQRVLAFAGEHIDIDRLTQLADNMFEAMSPQVTPVLNKSSDERTEELEHKIDDLTGQLMIEKCTDPIFTGECQYSRRSDDQFILVY